MVFLATPMTYWHQLPNFYKRGTRRKPEIPENAHRTNYEHLDHAADGTVQMWLAMGLKVYGALDEDTSGGNPTHPSWHQWCFWISK